MTARDRIVVIVLAAVVAIGGFWFLAISPKRAESKKQDAALSAVQQRLSVAQASAATAATAKQRYTQDYATVARLGKAVPVDDDVPSLVYQLQSTAAGQRINFRSIQLSSSGAAAPAAPTQKAAVAAAAGTPNASGAAGASGASGASGATDPASTAAAALPPGATVGSAGFPTMPFSFTFDGSFFHMERFLRELDALTTVRGDSINVTGRLLTVDGFSLAAGPKGFPQITASLSATAYLLPADEGLTAGATSTAPAATPAAGSAAPASAAEITGRKR